MSKRQNDSFKIDDLEFNFTLEDILDTDEIQERFSSLEESLKESIKLRM